MAYPAQIKDFFGKSHNGDQEFFELRLFSVDPNLVEWRVGEFVFPPHGGDYMYYGSADILATRADLLGTSYLWVAADQNGHGTWGGGPIDSEDCSGGDAAFNHDCFEGNFEDALANKAFWWFDPSRDLGEPEALRFDAWPLEARGLSKERVVPQILREPNDTRAAFISNSTGYGITREYIRYQPGIDIPSAKRFCGWRCPSRKSDGSCVGTNDNMVCDGGGVTFPSLDGSTVGIPGYAELYDVGKSFYHDGPIGTNSSYQHADFAYQLWGAPNLKRLESGNVVNGRQYESLLLASSTWSDAQGRDYGVATLGDGDRNGHGWSAGAGGWSSASVASPTTPPTIFVAFAQKHTIRRFDVLTVQDNPDMPVEPTASTLANQFGVKDYTIEYCSLAPCSINNDTGWQPLVSVVNNNRAWRPHTFAPITTSAFRIRITAAHGGYARLVELEAWE
jgi:hypothetical protein